MRTTTPTRARRVGARGQKGSAEQPLHVAASPAKAPLHRSLPRAGHPSWESSSTPRIPPPRSNLPATSTQPWHEDPPPEDGHRLIVPLPSRSIDLKMSTMRRKSLGSVGAMCTTIACEPPRYQGACHCRPARRENRSTSAAEAGRDSRVRPSSSTAVGAHKYAGPRNTPRAGDNVAGWGQLWLHKRCACANGR